jgi:hypothetical protein
VSPRKLFVFLSIAIPVMGSFATLRISPAGSRFTHARKRLNLLSRLSYHGQVKRNLRRFRGV